jgi:hypothetical protein
MIFLFSIIIPLILYKYLDYSIINNCIIILVSVVSVALSTWFIGLSADMRAKLKGIVISKIRNK